MLSSPIHIHAILKLAPFPSQGNAFGAHFLQLYRKNEYADPHFLFHDFSKNSASFQWEKNWHKIYVLFFGNFIKVYGLSHNGSNSEYPNQQQGH